MTVAIKLITAIIIPLPTTITTATYINNNDTYNTLTVSATVIKIITMATGTMTEILTVRATMTMATTATTTMKNIVKMRATITSDMQRDIEQDNDYVSDNDVGNSNNDDLKYAM